MPEPRETSSAAKRHKVLTEDIPQRLAEETHDAWTGEPRNAASRKGQHTGTPQEPIQMRPAANDDDGWVYTEEAVNPQDPMIAGPRWRDALREIAEHDYLDGDECRRIAKEALA